MHGGGRNGSVHKLRLNQDRPVRSQNGDVGPVVGTRDVGQGERRGKRISKGPSKRCLVAERVQKENPPRYGAADDTEADSAADAERFVLAVIAYFRGLGG